MRAWRFSSVVSEGFPANASDKDCRYASNVELIVDDGYPTLEGLKHTIEIQALTDARAAKAKAEDFVDLRFVDEIRKTGYLSKLK